MALELRRGWDALMQRPDRVIVGDWQSASFTNADEQSRYADQYEALLRSDLFRGSTSKRCC